MQSQEQFVQIDEKRDRQGDRQGENNQQAEQSSGPAWLGISWPRREKGQWCWDPVDPNSNWVCYFFRPLLWLGVGALIGFSVVISGNVLFPQFLGAVWTDLLATLGLAFGTIMA